MYNNQLNYYDYDYEVTPIVSTLVKEENEIANYEAENNRVDGQQSKDIAGNKKNISKNTSNISKNTSNISKNTSNISKNTTSISGLSKTIAAQETKIAKQEAAIAKMVTKEEFDAAIKAKENEIYNLTTIVGTLGGAVTYTMPNDLSKSFTSLMGNNGTIKLNEDVSSGRYGPGMSASNKVKVNLNGHNLTVSGLTISSTQGAIMARGTQEITIYGKGTVDAGQGICIQGNGANAVINLTGSTTTYQNDRSGGELVYCYQGTINIKNGIFINNGSDKSFLLNCYDANYKNGSANIIVTGGQFYDFNPASNTVEGPNTSFVPEGYTVSTKEEGGHTIYTVKKA